MRSALIIAALLCASVAKAENRMYQVIPASLGPGCPDNLAGGVITTDGTLGLLSPENIVSMSIDIRLGSWVVERGTPPQFLDGSTTLDLTNAMLSMEGQIVATPSGIFVATPPLSPYQREFGTSTPEPDPNVVRYQVALDGGDAHIVWSSVNLESYGVNNFIVIDSPPAGGVGLHFSSSGLIARAVPEPATLMLCALFCAASFLVGRGSRKPSA